MRGSVLRTGMSYDNHSEYQYCSDIYVTYHDDHIKEYRLMRDALPRRSHWCSRGVDKDSKASMFKSSMRTLSLIIGLVSFNWHHTRNKPLNVDNRYLREHRVPQSKSTIVKNKYAIRYLTGQEKMCRLSGVAQRITPQLLELRQRDQDTHRVLKVALQPRPTPAGMKSVNRLWHQE